MYDIVIKFSKIFARCRKGKENGPPMEARNVIKPTS